MTSFHKALDIVMELPPDDRHTLIDIVLRRMIEERRSEIADEAREAVDLYKSGKLKSQTAEEAIKELEDQLRDDTEH